MLLDMKERFLDLRTRIQSYRSGRFAYGWIADANPPEFAIDFNKRDCGCIGDRYHIGVVDGIELFMIDAVLKECHGDRGVFEKVTELRSSRSTESMRLRVSLSATITFDNREYPSTVIDLAVDGLGVLSNASIARGKTAEIEIGLERGSLKLIGRSLHCHETKGEKMANRIGLHIPHLDQLIDPVDGNLRRAVYRAV
jgi:hypothetical protein